MNNFVFYNPVKLIFGEGTISKIAREIPQDKRVLITFGGGSVKSNGVYKEVRDALKDHTCFEFWGIEPNPTVQTIRKAVELLKREKIGFILAVGGGSVLDASKLIAAAGLFDGDPWDLVLNPSLYKESLPYGTVLTLPATGSEMNRGAVISNSDTHEKFSFYSTYPRFSVLDPVTTFSLPQYQIACGLADTFIHVIEQYLTKTDESPLMDRWAESILSTVIEVAPRITAENRNYSDMATFMLSATMALNGFISMGVSQDWATHLIGHELTALKGITHGHTLAIILPGTMWELRNEKMGKILQYGKRVWDIDCKDNDKAVKMIIEKTGEFFRSLGLKIRLSENGVGEDTIKIIRERFRERDYHLGENRSVDAEVAERILRYVL